METNITKDKKELELKITNLLKEFEITYQDHKVSSISLQRDYRIGAHSAGEIITLNILVEVR